MKMLILGDKKTNNNKNKKNKTKDSTLQVCGQACLDSQETEYLCFVKATSISQICTMCPLALVPRQL